MQSIDRQNPLTLLLYISIVGLLPAFAGSPILSMLSLTGALLLFGFRGGHKRLRIHIWGAVLFVSVVLICPIFNHRGQTVLWVINNQPITWESILYGTSSAIAMLAVYYWFWLFSEMMRDEKLFWLFGRISPKFALVLSMTLHFVPQFAEKSREIRNAQRGIGRYRDDRPLTNLKNRLCTFSVLLTWGVENGIITADSMEARGYGSVRRTFSVRYPFRRSDGVLLTFCGFGWTAALWQILRNRTAYTFFPTVQMPSFSVADCLWMVCYGILCLIPAFLELWEGCKWKYLCRKM